MKSSLCRKFANSLAGKHTHWLNVIKNSSQEQMEVKGEPRYFFLQCTLKMMEQLLFFFCLLAFISISIQETGKQGQATCIINLFYLCMTQTINQRYLRQKILLRHLFRWVGNNHGWGTVLQTRSCWTTSSSVIPFSPNTGLLNSSGVALNNKVSAFLVWSQATSQRDRERKESFLLWDDKFCLHLATITCWHWNNQLGVREHMEGL